MAVYTHVMPLKAIHAERVSAQVHRKFEEQFWGTKMALSNGTPLSSGTAPAEYSVAALTETKRLMEDFLADPKKLERTRELLKASDLSPEQRKVLTLFERTFKCYIMEDAEARRLREEATKIEGTLESARNKSVAAPKRARIKCSIQSMRPCSGGGGGGGGGGGRMRLGATIGGEFKELSSVGLRNRMRTDDDEALAHTDRRTPPTHHRRDMRVLVVTTIGRAPARAASPYCRHRVSCVCAVYIRRRDRVAVPCAGGSRACGERAGRGCGASGRLSSPTASSTSSGPATAWPRPSGPRPSPA